MNQNTIKEILKFRDDRDWKQFHNLKDLAISLSLEASELLENFQWKSSEDAIEQNLENIKDELADVLIYSILLADQMNLDIEEVVQNKLEKNKRKYPVKKSFGLNKKYNEL
ncbi:nucleotide pyrophosphohydrolase [Bacillus thuringiensis]|uniref:nucleotide pyrophosphohydrolase n=1 Tax=Bacillus thuringiensis TaxID=1428 RepID=UPI000BF30111|nr:nucleotide pyrophosphohydrolase [Bacillus thuringiensis]PFF57744.1 nucleotide pyrophosphohydrolase [Bacillus thuringiensis]PGN27900.1 nucleotide pyrophosphohydrolase [Bacillus thuringiensis]